MPRKNQDERKDRQRERCTARSRRSGKQCKSFAMHGETVCRMHGGAAAKVNRKHGLHSKGTRARLADRIERLLEDPQLLNLDRQVATARAGLEEVESQIESVLEAMGRYAQVQAGEMDREELTEADVKAIEVAPQAMETLRRWVDTASQAIERRLKLQNASDNMVPLEAVLQLCRLFAKALNEHVDDPAQRRRIIVEATRGTGIGGIMVSDQNRARPH